MHKWQLKPGDPLSLTLAADARFSSSCYSNDHIWEMVIGAGEPPVLALQTTYGLRARSLRIFPRFIQGNHEISDPADFIVPVTVHHFYPNYLAFSFSPLTGLDVESEYWVPTPQAIAGRLRLTNQTKEAFTLRVEWVSLLNPEAEGERISVQEMSSLPVLAGRTANLNPIFYLENSTQSASGPFPALGLDFQLEPGQPCQHTWVQSAREDPGASFDLARQTLQNRWDAEIARIELTNTDQVEIHTGNPDWDSAFALSLKVAFGLIHQNQASLPAPSFVSNRLPDQGYSLRGDGSDYNHLWNGQQPLEVYYLSSLLLPAAAPLVKGLLENFIATQTPEGFIDWKPGLAGQRSQLLATPILATLAWRVFQATEDKSFLEKIFPALLSFLQNWFTPQHDRDGDGIPEWDHPTQTGFDEHPLFSRWHSSSQSVEINTVESPDLCSYLYSDCLALIKIASLVGREETIPALEALADNLKTAVESTWNENSNCYHYWDRDSHFSTHQEALGSRQGPGEILVDRAFAQPVRLVIRLQSQDIPSHNPQLFLHGFGPTGEHRIENIPPERFRWHLGVGHATSERVYAKIEQVSIQDILADDIVTLETTCLHCQDQTLLTPLWAGIPSPGRARIFIKETITSARYFLTPYGLRACVSSPSGKEEVDCYNSIYLFWNFLVCEGLLSYGQRARAADLLTRMMKAIIQNLKRVNSFHRFYHAQTGQGYGDRDTLLGLAPVGLFLDILGIRIIHPQKVFLSGPNPFPWPVTVKYQGLTILHQKKRTMVIFPDGQNITIRNNKPHLITQEGVQ